MYHSYAPIDFVISIVLFLIMLGVGLSLTTSNYKALLKQPKPILIGLIGQLLLLPLLVFSIVVFIDIPPEIKVGFLILSACPGGTTSGFITYLFKGDTALSISLTSINGIITLFTIPLIVNLSLSFFLRETVVIYLPYLETIIQIFLLTILPAFLGLTLRMKYEKIALKLQEPMKYILMILLGIVFVVKFFASKEQGGAELTAQELISIIPWALLINGLAFSMGYFVSRLNALRNKQSFTIGIEVAIQNTSLAFLIAGTLLQNQDMLKPALVYSMFSFWSAILYAFIIKRGSVNHIFQEFK